MFRLLLPMLLPMLLIAIPVPSPGAADDGPTGARRALPGVIAATTPPPPLDDRRWQPVPGCARHIAAGDRDEVYVVGCDTGAAAAGSVYRWNGAAFAPMPVPGAVSQLARQARSTWGIGADHGLYVSHADQAWQPQARPGGQPLTALAVGYAGLWAISGEPTGEGGNRIYRALPCNAGPGRCERLDWQAVSGAATRIAVGREVWVLANGGGIFRRVGEDWQRQPGCALDIAANGAQAYAVGCRRGAGDGNVILRWTGERWAQTKAAGRAVAVDAAGTAWVLTDSGSIWRTVSPR